MERPGSSLRLRRDLIVLFVTVIAIQSLCRYFPHAWLWQDHFSVFRFVLRLVVPVVVAITLGWNHHDLGLSLPMMNRGSWMILANCIILILAIVPLVRFDQDSLSYYAIWNSPFLSEVEQVRGFALFILSSVPGWEFLHRGFLLFGLRRICIGAGARADFSAYLAVSTTAAFEVLFHLSKPGMEAAGMMLASPLLSILALRTGSLWIPLFLHLFIEAVFYCAIA